MKIPWLPAFLAVVSLVAGCEKTPPSSAPQFAVAATYTVDLAVGDNPSRRLQMTITIGKPMPLKQYMAERAWRCLDHEADQDRAVPFSIELAAETLPQANQTPMILESGLATDATLPTALPPYFLFQTHSDQCLRAVPADGASPEQSKASTQLIYHLSKYKRFDGYFGLVAKNAPIPAEALFWRLSPAQSPPTDYKITQLVAVVAEPNRLPGHRTGQNEAYFIPLGNASPCRSFANGQPMACSLILP